MLNRLYRWRWVILSLFFWFNVFLHMPAAFLDFGGDSAQYIVLSESLAHGTGYHAVNYPDAPFFYHYPPMFSLLLTPIILFWGRNFFLMHLLVALAGYHRR